MNLKAAPNAKIVYVGSSEKLFTRYEKVTTDLGKIYGKEDKAKALNDELDKKLQIRKNVQQKQINH